CRCGRWKKWTSQVGNTPDTDTLSQHAAQDEYDEAAIDGLILNAPIVIQTVVEEEPGREGVVLSNEDLVGDEEMGR
ncbi:unnamed protein product, partial [Choristocarpus tenellus]